ncbi:MAG: DUF1697 domain-containing protein [bacterium]|nr:DUF1697 domain-containing protein [bacterium]
MTAVSTYVALLRGVNVGGNNKIPMAALRSALEAAGFDRVRTYIQSGNVLVDSRKAKPETLAARVRAVIDDTFGLEIATIVVDSARLASVVAATPYGDEPDPRRVHVFFLPAEPTDEALAKVAQLQEASAAKGARDSITVDGAVMYLHTPDGFGTSDLAKSLSTRGAGIHRSGTARNWATVTTLLRMCES